MAHFLDSKIKPFDAPGSARDGADLEFRAHVVGYRKDDFSVTLSGHGFEAHRYLTPSDLRELRDWIDAALNEGGAVMTRTYSQDFNRDDEAETEVTVEYTISGGCSAHYGSMTYAGHPAEAPEVEIVKAYTNAGPVDLTQAEDERFCQWIIENHEDEGDDPADYADWRDA